MNYYQPPPQASPPHAPPPYAPPPYAPPPYLPPSENRPLEDGKSRKALWITIILVAAIIGIAVAVFFILFRTAGPMLLLGKALNNLGTEVDERFNSTPFKAFAMLPEILEDGTVIVNFDYKTTVLGDLLTANVGGSVKLSSNTETREYALGAELNAYGETFDIDAYMNRERIALRLQLLGDDFYGFRYDTFRDDIRVFGRLIRLDDQYMDMLSDIVDQISAVMNAEETDGNMYEAYTGVIENFARNLEVTGRRTNIVTGENRVRCTEVGFRITKETLVELLDDLYDVLENDDTIRSQLEMSDNPLLYGITGGYGSGYEQTLREFRNFIRDFQRNYSGDIELLFFINSDDRLIRAVINADMEYDRESTEFIATFDFGNSIEDTWVFEFHVIDEYSTENLSIFWDFEDLPGNQRNTVNIITTSDLDSITLISDWNQDSGDFALVYIDRWEKKELTGIFTTDDTNFRIAIDDLYPDSSDDSLVIEILAQTGAEIGEIEYINLDKWGSALIESIMRLIVRGLLS